MHEQRLTTRLINYWEQLRKESSAPQYERLNPGAIDEIWQNSMVLQVQPGTGERRVYTYVHCGTEIRKAVGQDLTGQTLTTNMKFFPGAKIIKRVDEVFDLAALTPLMDDGQFVNTDGKVVKYRACLLAFMNSNRIITHVMVGVSWRAF